MTNAVVTWNTVYMAAVIDQLRAEGKTVNEEDIAQPGDRFAHDGFDLTFFDSDASIKERYGRHFAGISRHHAALERKYRYAAA